MGLGWNGNCMHLRAVGPEAGLSAPTKPQGPHLENEANKGHFRG